MKKFFVLLSLFFLLFSCTNDTSKNENVIKISTSIIPIASITNYIWWDYVEATSIVPAWISPHSFDLKPQDMVFISDSDLIIYMWLDHIDNFLEKVIQWKNNLIVWKSVEYISAWKEVNNGDEHNHSIDPHIWTSAKNAKIIANEIFQKLVEIEPSLENTFKNNLESFKVELDTLTNSFINDNINKSSSSFIVFHDAYNYLFEDLWIDNTKKMVFQMSVITDPTISELKDLYDDIKSNNTKIIFKEPQFVDSNLTVFAEQNNLEVLDLDPLWTNSNYKWYIENYRNNLWNLENIYE